MALLWTSAFLSASHLLKFYISLVVKFLYYVHQTLHSRRVALIVMLFLKHLRQGWMLCLQATGKIFEEHRARGLVIIFPICNIVAYTKKLLFSMGKWDWWCFLPLQAAPPRRRDAFPPWERRSFSRDLRNGLTSTEVFCSAVAFGGGRVGSSVLTGTSLGNLCQCCVNYTDK